MGLDLNVQTRDRIVAWVPATAISSAAPKWWFQVSSDGPAPVYGAHLPAEDAEWDNVSIRRAAALDALLANLRARSANGESVPLDLNDF